MTIAILEICATTHYTLTNALIKTYSTDLNNQIVVYTSGFIAKVIKDGGVSNQTRFVIFDPKNNIVDFLEDIENTAFDRLHICTIADYFKAFTRFKPCAKTVMFHVHDIDTWFDASFKNTFNNFVYNLKNNPDKLREFARFGREIFVRDIARKRIVRNLKKENLYFIVLSASQKKYLSQFVANERIIAFPSIINEGIKKIDNSQLTVDSSDKQVSTVNSQQSTKTRICIPGMVTDTRRDYTGLFKILEQILPQIKGKLIFDFLGFVEPRELNLLKRLQLLEKMGLDVYYSADFVDAVTFDTSLDKADILLNNQIVNLSYSGKYGLTKESGLLFNIVRGAKPAIFPASYSVDKEFEGVLMYYNSDKELTHLLLGLANRIIDIEHFKVNAEKLAQKYTPHNLYNRLIDVGATLVVAQQK